MFPDENDSSFSGHLQNFLRATPVTYHLATLGCSYSAACSPPKPNFFYGWLDYKLFSFVGCTVSVATTQPHHCSRKLPQITCEQMGVAVCGKYLQKQVMGWI